jgi:hypothetical protein
MNETEAPVSEMNWKDLKGRTGVSFLDGIFSHIEIDSLEALHCADDIKRCVIELLYLLFRSVRW